MGCEGLVLVLIVSGHGYCLYFTLDMYCYECNKTTNNKSLTSKWILYKACIEQIQYLFKLILIRYWYKSDT